MTLAPEVVRSHQHTSTAPLGELQLSDFTPEELKDFEQGLEELKRGEGQPWPEVKKELGLS